MEALQSPLLDKILSNVEDCRRLALCSAVSRSWRKAASGIYPKSLSIPPSRYGRDPLQPEELYSIMKWFQTKQHEHYFDNVQDLEMLVGLDEDDTFSENGMTADISAALFHMVLMHVNCWPLQKCYIKGYFDLAQVTQMLPTSIQRLRLRPEGAGFPDHTSMSWFQRFPELKLLIITTCRVGVDGTSAGTFVLDGVLPKLECLSLNPWPIELRPEMAIATCFPEVINVVVHMPADKAEVVMTLPCLQYLKLLLRDVPYTANANSADLDWFQRTPSLTVKADSTLCKLCLFGPPATPFHLDTIAKPELELELTAVGRVGSHHHSGPFNVYWCHVDFDESATLDHYDETFRMWTRDSRCKHNPHLS